jgi:hypothetical protein
MGHHERRERKGERERERDRERERESERERTRMRKTNYYFIGHSSPFRLEKRVAVPQTKEVATADAV